MSDSDDLVGTPEEIASVKAEIALLIGEYPKGVKKPPGVLKAWRILLMKQARLQQRRERQARGTKLRLVAAVAAERTARRAIEEAALIVEERVKNLRLAIGIYAEIARKDLPKRLVQHLADPDKKTSMQAAALLTQIFIHATTTLQEGGGKKRRVAPGWPAEGTKG